MHPLDGALPEPYVPVRVTLAVVIVHHTFVCLLAAETRRTAGRLLFSFQYLRGTNLLTYRVSRAGPIPFHWPSYSLHFCLLLPFAPFFASYSLLV